MQWIYKLTLSSEDHSAPCSATKLCKLFISRSDESPPQLSRSMARIAVAGTQEFKKFDEFPELVEILKQLEDPMYNALKKEKKKQQKKRKVVQPPSNCVYVDGLPEDISVDEVYAHFKNIGSIQDDFITGKPRIKIYQNEDDGSCKGDGLVYFEKDLSVASAISYLNGSQIRPGVEIKVSIAEFDEMSGKDTGDKKKPRLDRAQLAIKKKIEMKRQKDKFSWQEEEDRTTGMRIVVFKNMFSPKEALEENIDQDEFFQDIEKDIGLECQRIGGDLEKITIFREHPEGVIAVKFKEALGADRVISSMSGRWFGGRRIQVEYFDGITNYKKPSVLHDESEDESSRLEKFGEWLENQSQS